MRRLLPVSGRSPREVISSDLDWASSPDGRPPPSVDDVTVHPDDELVGAGFDGPNREQFERLWRSLSPAHGWAHLYIGGNLANPHLSFRDPFVFLLHSNLDRLWASWQLRHHGFHHRRESSWRLDPQRMYGGLADGELLFPDPDQPIEFQREQARRELNNPMTPWNGGGNVFPWSVQPEVQSAKHPDIVRPPLYDRYIWDDQLCSSWAALLLAKRLPANDLIRAEIVVEAVEASQIEFVLEAGPEVSWWKGVTIPTGDGSDTEISTENDRRIDRITVARSALTGRELVFSKAIRNWFFIERWMMHRLADLEWLPPGCRVVLHWDDD